MQNPKSRAYLVGLMFGALGVVYGDIGTSPLYALRECFHGVHAIQPSRDNVLGVLSLIFWSLIIIVSIKYLTIVIRADNKGEGGILALLSLAFPDRSNPRLPTGFFIGVGVFGAALLYGDGMITPAISVLSAVEGLKVATPLFEPYIIPITIIILIGMFSFQSFGTGRVGKIFGPVTFIWFFSLALLGLRGILLSPQVFLSINPWYAVQFFFLNHFEGFVVLGSVFLVVTGSEALYADMGHFGKGPIRRAWFFIVLPSLLIHYFGQGALLLAQPETAENPFFNLAPKWALYPMVVLATMATVIACQALIAGAFSITMQGIQLGYLPRMEINHTSSSEKGQIYLPHVNWTLMTICIALVLGFRSSSNLAAAYGIAVSLTMLITSTLFYFAARRIWNWSRLKAAGICSIFILAEIAFFAANCLKIFHGGWIPLLIAGMIFTMMVTWKTGRNLLRDRLKTVSLPYDLFLQDIESHPPPRVSGTAVFMSGNPSGTPLALLHNLKHNKVLHSRVVLLTITVKEAPHVDEEERFQVEDLHNGFYRVTGRYGFMEEPDVPALLQKCSQKGLVLDPQDTTFFLSRETIIPSENPGMAMWRDKLFAILSRNAQPATAFFRLPANRVVELGMQIEI